MKYFGSYSNLKYGPLKRLFDADSAYTMQFDISGFGTIPKILMAFESIALRQKQQPLQFNSWLNICQNAVKLSKKVFFLVNVSFFQFRKRQICCLEN